MHQGTSYATAPLQIAAINTKLFIKNFNLYDWGFNIAGLLQPINRKFSQRMLKKKSETKTRLCKPKVT